MVQFQQISMIAFVIIFMINIGLVSVDASNTLDRKIFPTAEGMNFGLTYADLNSTLESVKPIDPATGFSCTWFDPLCNFLAVAQSVSEFGAWLGVASNIILFFLGYLPQLILGYHFALMMIADMLEVAATGPIHILLTSISGVIFIILAYGLWGFIRSIASIVPGVGGS